jgi:hypothetical protein
VFVLRRGPRVTVGEQLKVFLFELHFHSSIL